MAIYMEVVTELRGVPEALEILRRVARDGDKATAQALRTIAVLVQREAVKNAPRSPTRGQLNKLRKTRRKVTRKARATSRPAPGALENSIERESDSNQARIFVASNSAAGKYANRMHELKNKPSGWRNRGPGTVAKGSRADEKFIQRAIVDNEGVIMDILRTEHRKAGWYDL